MKYKTEREDIYNERKKNEKISGRNCNGSSDCAGS